MANKLSNPGRAGDIEYVPVDEEQEELCALLRLIADQLNQAGTPPAEQVISYGEQE